ncbi:MAG: DNA polymerase III subunit alpha [Bacteroidetes bacterium]|nr:MAG: DNA polymerase III subunit alpha [Bacteroidota bacterium]
MPTFSHLHVHTQFSLLDGAADISRLYNKAVEDNMPALAITDHGNMFGVFKFVAEAGKHNTKENPNVIKPIVGCEFYLVEDRHKRQFTKDDKDKRYHQLFLAKNSEGYSNLVKLCSLGYIDGLYGKYPRIDKELVLKYHKGLIATTCCLGASVPRFIIDKGEAEGEKEFKWWLDLFGDDYYIELQRHDIPEQNKVNAILLKWAVKYNVKVIASNDSHYVNQEDFNAHDILLCINTGEKQSTPTMKEFSADDDSSRGKRFAFYNDQFYFKKTEEMSVLFSDLPEAIDNTNEIVSKVEPLKLKQDILLPHFSLPENFNSQDDYLYHLTMEGARKRYVEITPEIEERLNFELFTIKTMGFAGYFLIVADFIKAGRDLGVFVGPGRGSAAGSAVAYSIGITNIDPLKYNLLFERFLNPDRKSMPDIDTDFDDVGRQKVIDYVVDKYGRNQVAQIVTYGTMAAKMSIKDVARVMDLPLQDSNMLAKYVPDRPGIELKRVIHAPLDGAKSLREKENLNSDEIEEVKKLRKIYEGKDLAASVLREALILEGSVRNTGIHAAGIIIAPKDLTDIIPVSTSKDTDLLITQYDGRVIEDAGVIKMDFLGLKTLTIIRDSLRLIEENHGVKIDIDTIPLDDALTLELYQRGETNGTFQFESAGMQKYLKDLRPDKFEDLIAMNALFRPGPLEYIPDFIARKNGKQKVSYDLAAMEEYLRETYGITVYQEQVMLLSQKLANFTKGDADTLRKAMGKKQIEVLNKMKSKFVEGCKSNGHDPKVCEKIWTDWEAFASYAFNKSHSTCYAFVAFQTAYLKSHYPAEYMSSVLTHNLSNIDKITFFMEECRRMNLPVLGPDVNESVYDFAVNSKGQIRFGLGAIKGVGENAVIALIAERKENGPFTSIFDLTRRISSKGVNKKCLESLAQSGAFDCFEGVHRAQYLEGDSKDPMTGIERAIRFGNAISSQQSSMQNSLFGEDTQDHISVPNLADCEAWGAIEKLKKEKEVIGFYISGHPLDDYRFEIKTFCSHSVEQLSDPDKLKNKEVTLAGILTEVNHRMSKMGKPFATFSIEDFTGTIRMALFGEDYSNMKACLMEGSFVYVKAKVQPRFNSSDQFEVRPNTMFYLSDVSDKLAKSLTLRMPLQKVSKELLNQMTDLLNNSPGNCVVKFNVVDQSQNLGVELPSKRLKVHISTGLIDSLNALNGLECILN